MKKVLLVNTNSEQAPYPVPPMGICMLASELDGLCEVRVFDGMFGKSEGLPETVRIFQPDYIGFGIRNIDDIVADRHIYYVDSIIRDFIEPVRKITSVPVIVGGSGFSMFPEELMELTGADYGIVGEAVGVLPRLLELLDSNYDPSFLSNVIVSGDKASTGNSNPPDIVKHREWQGFSAIYRWIDMEPYRARSAYSIRTKRGCAHGCIYCTYPVIEGHHFITRPAAEVADEIADAQEKAGNMTFEFVDSTFNDPEGHAEAICKEIIRRELRVRLRTMGINPRHTSRELFSLMIEAGFTQIDATPDTASPSMLKNLGKGFSMRDVKKMAELIRECDLPTMWFFLFGGPGEDEKTFRETIDFIDQYVNPADLVFMTSGLRVYPDTPLYRIALKEKKTLPGKSILYPPLYYFSDKLGKERLDRMIREAERKRPNCIPALETRPPEEMLAEAVELRKRENLQEPVFRTLLRVRKEWMSKGLI
jgi:radical SAM superfamily enzyme YgiQ (UPF0313 family)